MIKKTKRFFIMVFCIAFLFGIMAEAEGNTEFHVENQTGKAGDVVTVPVQFNTGQEVGGFQISVYYDSDVMEFHSLEKGNLILENGSSIIPLSIGAFADNAFKEAALKAAEESNTKIYIPSGAVGGFDVLKTISLMAEVNGWDIKAGIHTHKGPNSLKNTPLYSDRLQNKEETVFSGSTKEAIALLPTKVNVAVASALATTGPANVKAEITSVPGFIGDDHCIIVETEGLKATADIYSANSDIAAWSVVALLRNLSSPMTFF